MVTLQSRHLPVIPLHFNLPKGDRDRFAWYGYHRMSPVMEQESTQATETRVCIPGLPLRSRGTQQVAIPGIIGVRHLQRHTLQDRCTRQPLAADGSWLHPSLRCPPSLGPTLTKVTPLAYITMTGYVGTQRPHSSIWGKSEDLFLLQSFLYDHLREALVKTASWIKVLSLPIFPPFLPPALPSSLPSFQMYLLRSCPYNSSMYNFPSQYLFPSNPIQQNPSRVMRACPRYDCLSSNVSHGDIFQCLSCSVVPSLGLNKVDMYISVQPTNIKL